jgi:tetratricopeptide (TPR) repeat protein
VPRDAEWLPNLTSAVSAAVELRHPLLPELVARLEPYAHLVAFEGIGAGLHGVAGRFLAEAYLSLGRVDDAVRAARDALRVNRGIGGALTADAQRTLARCLEARGLATDAVEAAAMHAAADDAFRTYGLMRFVRAPVDTARDAAPPGAAHELIREGDVWRIAFRGDTVVVRHSKGLSDLALLLSRPGREVHVTEITQTVPGLVDPLHDPVLDPRAVGSYRTRLADLAEDIDEADAHHDLARAATLREEYDAIVAELSTAVGLGRRSRSLGSDPHERMRKAVTARIRDAIRRLGEQSPALGRHLTAGIRTGTFCSYQPETPVVWRCQP